MNTGTGGKFYRSTLIDRKIERFLNMIVFFIMYYKLCLLGPRNLIISNKILGDNWQTFEQDNIIWFWANSNGICVIKWTSLINGKKIIDWLKSNFFLTSQKMVFQFKMKIKMAKFRKVLDVTDRFIALYVHVVRVDWSEASSCGHKTLEPFVRGYVCPWVCNDQVDKCTKHASTSLPARRNDMVIPECFYFIIRHIVTDVEIP